MSAEQYSELIESIKMIGNSFNEDLWVAIISGVVTIAVSTIVSIFVSRGQSEKAREEMNLRINKEAEKNLLIQRKIIKENIELEVYNKLDNELFNLSKIPEELVTYIEKEGLFSDWTQEYRSNAIRKYKIPFDFFKLYFRKIDYYFSEDDLRTINACLNRISESFRTLIAEGELYKASNNPRAYLMTQIDDILTVVQRRRISLINKWDEESEKNF